MKKESQLLNLDWSIYKIMNPTGRVYIGKTMNFKNRMSIYKVAKAKNQGLLQNSLLKYGFNNHSVEIIDTFNGNNDYASGKEMFWVRTFMSHEPKYKTGKGMNLTDGGEGMVGYIASVETRAKQSVAKKGKAPHNKGKRGQPAWNKGLKVGVDYTVKPKKKYVGTEEERKIKFGSHNIGHTRNRGRKYDKKFIEDKAAKRRGIPNTALYKPILVYNINGEFIKEYPSAKHAAKELNVHVWTIGHHASGKGKKPQKFIFKFKN